MEFYHVSKFRSY